jgi:hypothetical protein
MTTDAFWEFEREGWSQAAAAYEEPRPDLRRRRRAAAARFADPDEARAALGKAGLDLDSLRVETVTVPWRVPTPELLFEAHLRAGVLVSTVLQAQPPERLEAIRAAIVEDVERYADGDEFTLPIVARVVSAATPGV